ncbi:Hypothetical protein FKW44_023148 [Caligus rogercresseyi]|uniref:Uncharacterized protein n=1 Tax=Caligus rogercresseyi TaxID=217165 RepID=A0A7T8GNL5_CALRO|nr:Hypothetical protein FKW44_023148 [Caligus rogercresseyi]
MFCLAHLFIGRERHQGEAPVLLQTQGVREEGYRYQENGDIRTPIQTRKGRKLTPPCTACTRQDKKTPCSSHHRTDICNGHVHKRYVQDLQDLPASQCPL